MAGENEGGDIKVVIEPAVVSGEDDAGLSKESVVVVKTGGDKDPLKALQEQHAALVAKDKEREEAASRERIEAEEARRRAAAAEQELAVTKTQGLENDLSNVSAGLDAAEQAFNSAKMAFRSAWESGDPDKVTEAQIALNEAQQSVASLRYSKAELEVRKQQQSTQRPAPKKTGDALEDFINAQSPRSAAWLRKRKEMLVDPAKANLISAGHYHALAKGLKGDTPEYFAHLEEYIGERDTHTNLSPPPPPPPPLGSRQPPVAPVINAGSPGGMQGGGAEVRLSQNEARSAQDGTVVWNYDDPSGQKKFKKGDPIGIEEFARRKQKMKADGLYDRAYLEE
jgi:hypothetical protein